MSDLFVEKNIKPMLIGAEGEPFDDADYIYELKVDGSAASPTSIPPQARSCGTSAT